jgi:hypothetical protein
MNLLLHIFFLILIYQDSLVRNLDPYFFAALAKSASSDHVPNLRDAMWSHLTFRASMRIKVAEARHLDHNQIYH